MTHQDTEDIIQIITSSGSDIDVLIVYRKSGIDQSKFEHKQKITTATTTSITLGVAQKVDILEINLFNIDASVSNDVTIQKYKSTIAYKIIKKTLAAGDSLNYAE
jgi:hypothetical protein